MNAQVVPTTVTQMQLVPTLEVHSVVAAKRDTLEMVDNAQVCTTLYVPKCRDWAKFLTI